MTSKNPSKKEWVAEMFNGIAPTYDLVNKLLSFGVDAQWRKRLVKELLKQKPESIIDFATGTGKLAFAIHKKIPVKIIGVDISQKMLDVAIAKNSKIEFLLKDSECTEFPDQNFDSVTVAFGIRNFENHGKGMQEAYRILKPKGCFYILEFSQPSKSLFGYLFRFYFRAVLPFIGRMISGHKKAYKYLNKSALSFMSGQQMLNALLDAGFENCREYRLTSGIATLYIGEKL